MNPRQPDPQSGTLPPELHPPCNRQGLQCRKAKIMSIGKWKGQVNRIQEPEGRFGYCLGRLSAQARRAPTIGGMIGGDMKGNAFRNRSEKAADRFHLLRSVQNARHEKGGDLKMAEFRCSPYEILHCLKISAQLFPVGFRGIRFEIHVRRVAEPEKPSGGLWVDAAVGDEDCPQAPSSGEFHGVQNVFRVETGLGIGEAYGGAARVQGLVDQRFGFEPEFTAKIAKGKKWRIYEVPVSYYGRTYADGKKIGWRDGFRAIWCILKYNVW